jgi:MFS family permease
MASLTILLLVREAAHSYSIAGLAVGVNALATALSAPVLGRFVDLLGRARVLAPVALMQAAAYLALAAAAQVHAPAAVLIVLAAVAGVFLPPIAAVVRALLRGISEDPAIRETAYALDIVLQEIVWIVGPLAVAVVVAITSPAGALVLLGAICLLGTSLFVRRLLAPVFLTGLCMGALELGLPSLAIHSGSRPASGLLLAAFSVGGVGGGLWYGSRDWGIALATRYQSALALSAVLSAPLIAIRSIPIGLLGSVVVGLSVGPAISCQYQLISRAAVRGSETEAFAWGQGSIIGGLSAGSALAGASIGSAGIGAPFLIACLAAALGAGIAVAFAPLAAAEPAPAYVEDGSADPIA